MNLLFDLNIWSICSNEVKHIANHVIRAFADMLSAFQVMEKHNLRRCVTHEWDCVVAALKPMHMLHQPSEFCKQEHQFNSLNLSLHSQHDDSNA